MNKSNVLLLVGLSGLTACAVTEHHELKQSYVAHYQQDSAQVARYKQHIQTLSAEQVAQQLAVYGQSLLKGKSSVAVDAYINLRRVAAQGRVVRFDHALTPAWKKLSIKAQQQQLAVLRQDLIYKQCSQATQLLAYQKGVEEQYRYFDVYPKTLAFEQVLNHHVCQQNGFKRVF